MFEDKEQHSNSASTTEMLFPQDLSGVSWVVMPVLIRNKANTMMAIAELAAAQASRKTVVQHPQHSVQSLSCSAQGPKCQAAGDRSKFSSRSDLFPSKPRLENASDCGNKRGAAG